MSDGRFDYVLHDDIAGERQAACRAACRELEGLIERLLPKGRAQSLAFTKLEEMYMWIGKAIRDDQIARTGSAGE